MRDEDVQEYLETMAAYEQAKKAAADSWRSAYIDLAAERLQKELTSKDHDPDVSPDLVCSDGELVCSDKSSGGGLMGAWPSQSLVAAQNGFSSALKHEVRANGLIKTLDSIEARLLDNH